MVQAGESGTGVIISLLLYAELPLKFLSLATNEW